MFKSNVKQNFHELGQSTIEFLIGFTIVFSMTFFMLKTTFTYGKGFLLHYATFMASRAYLITEQNNNGTALDNEYTYAAAQATRVFRTFKVNSGNIAFNNNNTVQRKILIGAYSEFETRFSPVSNMGGDEKITLRSESFLGKEPPRGYCHDRVLNSIVRGTGDGFVGFRTLYDNGC